MSRRFDCEDYVKDYEKRRAFPKIHNPLFQFFLTRYMETPGDTAWRVCDLCCSTGLLAQRIRVHGGMVAIGVDRDENAIGLGESAGIDGLVHLAVGPDTLTRLAKLLATKRINVVVMRRCIPELFDADPSWAPAFFRTLWGAGVTDLLVEGRKSRSTSRGNLCNIEYEIKLIQQTGLYKLAKRAGDCAHFVLGAA